MSIRTTTDRFKELGLKPPDLSFFQKPEKPGDRFGPEPRYNTRVLVDNWFEDRRQYKLLCSRCTGTSVTKDDYLPYCPEVGQEKEFPPIYHQRRIEADGDGWNLIRNTEDYCQYLKNYTTTTDLVHNWEIRRAGVKPKPWRKWKMVQDAVWVPNNDNTVSFGNLTQLGYRKAQQVPLLPNDWDLYAHTGYTTEYRENYPTRKFPQDYVHCRRAPNRELVSDLRDLCIAKKPLDPKNPCADASLYFGQNHPPVPPCDCKCDGDKGPRPAYMLNLPRFGNTLVPGMGSKYPAKQSLYLPRQSFPHKALKHPPHKLPEPCTVTKYSGTDVPDFCRDYAGDTRFDYKGVLKEQC